MIWTASVCLLTIWASPFVMCLFKYQAQCYVSVLVIYFDCRSFTGCRHWLSSNLWLFFSPSLITFSEHGFQFWCCLIHHFLILWLVIFVLYQKERKRGRETTSVYIKVTKMPFCVFFWESIALNSLLKVHGHSLFGVHDVRKGGHLFYLIEVNGCPSTVYAACLPAWLRTDRLFQHPSYSLDLPVFPHVLLVRM